MPAGDIAIIVIPMVVGLALSVLITWTQRPANLSSRGLAGLIVLTLAASVVVGIGAKVGRFDVRHDRRKTRP